MNVSIFVLSFSDFFALSRSLFHSFDVHLYTGCVTNTYNICFRCVATLKKMTVYQIFSGAIGHNRNTAEIKSLPKYIQDTLFSAVLVR